MSGTSGSYNAVTRLLDRNVDEGRGGKLAFTDTVSELTYGDLQKQSCRWQLRANVTTRACYPFEFALDVTYELRAATLTVLARVSNEDRTAMPVSFGFHPALRWPLPYHRSRENHEIRFEVSEPAPARRLRGGLLARAIHDTPVCDKRLELHDDLFLDDVLILDRVVSRKILYGATKGPSIELAFPGMPHLGIWSKPGAGFVCIEPWQGFAAPEDFDGELKDKPGNVILQPGSARSFCMTLSLIGVCPSARPF